MTDSKDKQVREKLASRGATALTDAELLSILLGEGSGSHGISALETAEHILQAEGSLAALAMMDLPKLRMVGGMGIKKAATVAAAFEMAGRMARQQADKQSVITTDADVENIFRPLLSGLPHEEFWVVYLSAGNRIADKIRISQGGVSATVVDHKLIVKRAVEHLCTAIIVVHNHPSGAAQPSDEDIALTHKLETAASLFDIALLDHVIITRNESYSFRKHGLIRSDK